MSGPQYLRDEAIKAAEKRLKAASVFVWTHIKNPLFQKRMGPGSSWLVRFEYPGVLSVCDPETGRVFAVSEPGRPDVLKAGFAPDVPALDSTHGDQ